MTVEKAIDALKDPCQKQLLFFYELCRAGVVKFDFGNPEHVALFNRMGKMMQDSLKKGTDSPFKKSSNLAVYRIIVLQLHLHHTQAKH